MTPDQRANRAFQSGEPERAAQLFEDRKWRGAAAYRAGDFDRSVEALEGLEDPDSLYNKGNSLASLSRYQEALDAYNQVLESDPDHRDALYNKELVEEHLKQQQSQDSSNQNSDEQEGDQQEGDQQASQKGEKSDSNGDPTKSDSEQNQQDSSQRSDSDAPNSNDRKENHDGEENNENKPEIGQQAEPLEQNQDQTESNKAELSQSNTPDESEQANEQWLRRIPDDPGRLLREKFRYQYSRRDHRDSDETEAW